MFVKGIFSILIYSLFNSVSLAQVKTILISSENLPSKWQGNRIHLAENIHS